MRGVFWKCCACGAQNHETDGECQFCECGGAECKRDNCSGRDHLANRCPGCNYRDSECDCSAPMAAPGRCLLTARNVAAVLLRAAEIVERGWCQKVQWRQGCN